MLMYMNFVNDHDELIRQELVLKGIDPDSQPNPLGRYATLYALNERTVPIQPYEIKRSLELTQSPYHGHLEAVIDEVERAFKVGDVTPYLSTAAFLPDFKDHLLVHWGIHHLHLNPISSLSPNGHVKRSDYLLFFRISGRTVHLIDILEHRDPEVFVKKRLLEVVDKNWPELHEPLSGTRTAGKALTSEQQKTLNKKNGNAMVALANGRTVMPAPGSSSAGTPIAATIEYDSLCLHLEHLERVVRDQPEKFISKSGWAVAIRLVGLDKKHAYIQSGSSGQTVALSISSGEPKPFQGGKSMW